MISESSSLTAQVQRRIIGQHTDWLKRFNPIDYYQNIPMIEKLYEEKQIALTKSYDLETRVEDLLEDLKELQLENQRLKIQVVNNDKLASVLFSVSLLATILVGIGINLVTANPPKLDWLDNDCSGCCSRGSCFCGYIEHEASFMNEKHLAGTTTSNENSVVSNKTR